MKFFKYLLLTLGVIGIIASIYNSIVEGSVYSNKWTFIGSAGLIWFAFKKDFPGRFVSK